MEMGIYLFIIYLSQAMGLKPMMLPSPFHIINHGCKVPFQNDVENINCVTILISSYRPYKGGDSLDIFTLSLDLYFLRFFKGN